MIAKHKTFNTNTTNGDEWFSPRKYDFVESMMNDVDKFLTEIGKDRLISVHGIDSERYFLYGVIVWYWEES